jgi:hypothetical protein
VEKPLQAVLLVRQKLGDSLDGEWLGLGSVRVPDGAGAERLCTASDVGLRDGTMNVPLAFRLNMAAHL